MPPRTRIINSDGTTWNPRFGAGRDVSFPTVVGVDLAYVQIDHRVGLWFADVCVVIESAFRLCAKGHDLLLNPAHRDRLGPLLAVYPDTLDAMHVGEDLGLSLAFRSGATIAVAVDPNYEAWQVNGPGRSLVVCPPGGSGGLAIWS